MELFDWVLNRILLFLNNHLAVNINPADTGFIDASETFEIKTNSENENEYYKLTIKVPGRLYLRISSVA